MKVVLDTNVLISAIVFGCNPDKIIHLLHDRKDKILLTPFILNELSRNLGKKEIGWSNFQISYAIKNLLRISKVVEPKLTINKIRIDPSDNKILECAMEGEADYIISGDKKHVLPLKKYNNIPIMSPQDFLKILYEKEN